MKKINLKNIFLITKKELRSYFDSPVAYVILIVFLILLEFLFFRNVFIAGQASLRMLFVFLPWLYLLLIPAITMGSISEEKSTGTWEFLLTHPIRDLEFLLGKFFSSLVFVLISLIFVLPLSFSLNYFGNLDWGVVLGQVLSSMSLALVLISLGILISSFFKNQIASLLTSIGASFFLVVAGFDLLLGSVPLFLTPYLETFSSLSHFSSMSRGVIDIRDLWYFISFTSLLLFFSYFLLKKRKLKTRIFIYKKYKITLFILIIIFIFSNIFVHYIPGRIDLTDEKIYSLSPATKNVLANLEEKVNIVLFSSGKFPADFQSLVRQVRDVLQDYKILGNGQIILEQKNPQKDVEILAQAQEFGIQEIQFNVRSKEELQLKNGYFGLVILFEHRHEAIPFLNNTSDLEYQLTSFIKKLTDKNKEKIVFLSGYDAKILTQDFNLLNQELSKQFIVEDFVFNEENNFLPENAKVLIVPGPKEELDQSLKMAIEDFINKGNSVLFLIDAVSINFEDLSVLPIENNFSLFLKDYGIEIEKNIVYDLRSNETVRFGGGMLSFALPYPFWPKIGPALESSLITSRLETLVMPWSSSIKINEKKALDKGFKVENLLATTKYAGEQKDEFFLSPQQKLSSQNLERKIMSVVLEPKDDNSKGKIIVLGDSDFLTDTFLSSSPENLGFGIEIVSYLAQQESLAEIKLKQIAKRDLVFQDQTQIMFIKYGNMALVVLIPLLIGFWRFMRRRNLKAFKYFK